jgi:putative OPT family oligopeptide transporter
MHTPTVEEKTQSREEKPYVPAETTIPELTFKALALGLVVAVLMGAANAYLGLKAGMTIAATIPAAVIAIAAFRLPFFRGTVLEQNIARTAASVGEALVSGAIFTLPALVMVELGGQRIWTSFNYWESSLILMIGGLLGIMFVIVLRRALCVEAGLPFPEAYACNEVVKVGQKGASGAKYVFGAMGGGLIIELLKNPSGLTIFRDTARFFIQFPQSVIEHFNTSRVTMGRLIHTGGMAFSTPTASPALMSVGFIIGPRLAAINFSGGVLAWLVFIPLALFLNPQLQNQLTMDGQPAPWNQIASSVWYNEIRPMAVGAMLVGSLYTLYGLKDSIIQAFRGAFSKKTMGDVGHLAENRLEKDINFKTIIASIVGLVIPITVIYYYFTDNLTGALVAAVVMIFTGFLFCAVGGWLVGLVGSSNQPLSGLTLSTLVVAALLMVAIGLKGLPGIGATLIVAAVVCCAASVSGSLIQDLKVGHLLGGTPWKMEVAEIISTAAVSFVLVYPLIILHKANLAGGGIGIGDTALPAPQAGLMAQLAKGIIGGQMPWGLILMGMFFALALIMVKAPAPMLIAVGMYLPFETTFAIFAGGVCYWLLEKSLTARSFDQTRKDQAINVGTLIASGFIAGEALTGVLLAAFVLQGVSSLTHLIFGMDELPLLDNWGGWLSLLIFGVVAWGLIRIPARSANSETT